MVTCSADDAGQILTISYSGHVTPVQMGECLEVIRERMQHVRDGFIVLADLTNLEAMDDTCATALGEIMEWCSAKGMTASVRVIPDPTKDIGFNLIALFHYQKPVRTFTFPSLAEAMKCLIAEFPSLSTAT